MVSLAMDRSTAQLVMLKNRGADERPVVTSVTCQRYCPSASPPASREVTSRCGTVDLPAYDRCGRPLPSTFTTSTTERGLATVAPSSSHVKAFSSRLSRYWLLFTGALATSLRSSPF